MSILPSDDSAVLVVVTVPAWVPSMTESVWLESVSWSVDECDPWLNEGVIVSTLRSCVPQGTTTDEGFCFSSTATLCCSYLAGVVGVYDPWWGVKGVSGTGRGGGVRGGGWLGAGMGWSVPEDMVGVGDGLALTVVLWSVDVCKIIWSFFTFVFFTLNILFWKKAPRLYNQVLNRIGPFCFVKMSAGIHVYVLKLNSKIIVTACIFLSLICICMWLI